MRRRGLAFGLSFVMAMALFNNPAIAGEVEQSSLPRQFPASTVLYFAVENAETMLEKFPATALGKIWNEPEVQEFLKIPREQLAQQMTMVDALLAMRGINLTLGDFKKILAKRAAFGLAIDFKGGVRGKPRFAQLVVAEMPDEAQGAEFFTKFIASLKTQLPPPLLTNVAESPGSAVFHLANGSRIALGSAGNLFRLAITHGGILPPEQLAAFISGSLGDDSLAAQKSYQEMAALLGQPRESVFYFNTGLLYREIQAQAEQNNFPSAPGAGETLGATQIKGVGVNVTTDETGYHQRIIIHVPVPPAERKGLLGLFNAERVSREILNAVPQKVEGFTALRFDSGGVLGVIREAAVSGGIPEELFNSRLEMLKAQLGFDLEKDLLTNLGEEMALAQINANAVGGLPIWQLNSQVLIIRVKDEAAVTKAMDALCGAAAGLAANSAVGGELLRQEYNGIPIGGVRLVYGGVFAPAYAIHNGFLILGGGPQAVRLVLDAIAGKVTSIRTDPEFRKAVTRLAQTSTPMVSFSRKPEFSYLGAGPGSPITTLPVMAGLLLPALSRARGAAEAVSCLDNLKQIGTGMMMYKAKNGNLYPEKLEDLFDNGGGVIPDLRIFKCPTSGAGYHYIGGEAAGTIKADMIMVWDVANVHNGYCNALFRDGHVKRVRLAEFNRKLQAVRDYCLQEGIAFHPQAPFVEGAQPGMAARQGGFALLNPFAQLTKNPEGFFQALLTTFRLYQLPSADCINRHLISSAVVGRVTAEGLIFERHSLLPVILPPINNPAIFVLPGLLMSVERSRTHQVEAIARPQDMNDRIRKMPQAEPGVQREGAEDEEVEVF